MNYHNAPNSFWTDERVEQLISLFKAGWSASQIAGELGNVSRNAVIGKVHRLGLEGRAKKVTGSSRSNGPEAQKIGAATRRPRINYEALAIGVADLVPLNIPLLELTTDSCRYVYGDIPSEYTFCGHKIAIGAFCGPHAGLCYRPPEKRWE